MRKVLVTGGTSGIGKALVELLQKRGWEVFSFGSQKADLRQTTQPIVEAIHAHAPDVVINCAGIGRYGDALDISLQEQKEIVQVNAIAAMEITLEAARFFKKQQIKGTILNVSSLSGELPSPGMATYGASKAFLTKFSLALDFELKPDGIRVLVCSPGMVRTGFMHRSAKKVVHGSAKGPVMSAQHAAECIYRQIQTKKGFAVIDWRYHLLYRLFFLIPKSLLKSTIYKNIQARL